VLQCKEKHYTITIAPSGLQFQADAATPLLAAARVAGVVLPSSCRNGTCRTCICRLLSGEVRYSIAWPGISADEKAEGLILACVAHACSDLVIEEPRAAAILAES
jgi:ferredoxin